MLSRYRFLFFVWPLLTTGCAKSLSHTFTVSKETVQKKLNEKFPLSPGQQDGEEAALQITLSDPVVLLEDGRDQIGVRVNLVVEPPQREPRGPLRPPPLPKPRLTGTATVFATITYDADAKALRLGDPKITALQIDQLPDKLESVLRRLAEKALAQKLAEQPIPLGNTTALDKVARTFLKAVTIKDGKILVEIGW